MDKTFHEDETKFLLEHSKYCISHECQMKKDEIVGSTQKHLWVAILGSIALLIGVFILNPHHPSIITLGNFYPITEILSICSNLLTSSYVGPICSQFSSNLNIGRLFAIFLIFTGVYEIHYSMKI